MATHELREAEALCDHVAVMEGGKVLETGPLPDIIPPADMKPAVPVAGAETTC